jgi:phosphatidylserine/phosphatidylglycerophosphate/cardiolipin synthase-like enzyme
MSEEFEVSGTNGAALFTLKAHRGDGMVLLGMNWKDRPPLDDFVGFAIEYKEPRGHKFWPLTNRLNFPGPRGTVDHAKKSTLLSPIQKFRWVHFPRHAGLEGAFTYRVSPVFMNGGVLSLGDPQRIAIELRRDTYPGELNVAFTRGFVSSQAFVDDYGGAEGVATLLPTDQAAGLAFASTNPKAEEAYAWMGFEARDAIHELLNQAIADTQAEVRVIAYDLNLPEVVDRLRQLGSRLKIVIDDSDKHGLDGSAESHAAETLRGTAGVDNVKRQHLGKLQHNKTIVVNGPSVQAALCGSTNLSWRGLYVQANNAVIVRGPEAIRPFLEAFEAYWEHDDVAGFGGTASAEWTPLGLAGIDANVAFSPHSANNALLQSIADDIGSKTTSNLLYSLAFLYQTPGVVQDAIRKVMDDQTLFVYGMSDKRVGGLEIQTPDGKIAPVYPSQLAGKGVPEPFKSEPSAAGGVRMHHKFVVVDFDKPTARVYLGSYNFSKPADRSNGENLVLIRDRRIAVSYAVEALTLLDHYLFRILQADAKRRRVKLQLKLPPNQPGDTTWWDEDYTDPRKIRDRELFS